MMANFICHLDWATGSPNMCLNIISRYVCRGAFRRVSIWICWAKQTTLPGVGGQHAIHWGREQNMKVVQSALLLVCLGWDKNLPFPWHSWFSGLRLTPGSTQLALYPSGLQTVSPAFLGVPLQTEDDRTFQFPCAMCHAHVPIPILNLFSLLPFPHHVLLFLCF